MAQDSSRHRAAARRALFSGRAAEITEALGEAEAEFDRGEGLSGDEMRRHFGLE